MKDKIATDVDLVMLGDEGAAGCATALHGQPAVIGGWQVRNHHGFHQSREGCKGQWLFYVSGFGRVVNGEHIECSVLKFDGRTEVVPIDKAGRITILGRKFGRSRWHH